MYLKKGYFSPVCAENRSIRSADKQSNTKFIQRRCILPVFARREEEEEEQQHKKKCSHNKSDGVEKLLNKAEMF